TDMSDNKRNSLINLKRDIYNDRSIDINEYKEKLNGNIYTHLSRYCRLSKLGITFASQFDNIYENKLFEIRKNLKDLLDNALLKNALLFSSRILLKQLRKYCQKNINEFSRNEIKAENGFIKYLTRMKTKTSPFSTFTSLSIASVDNIESAI